MQNLDVWDPVSPSRSDHQPCLRASWLPSTNRGNCSSGAIPKFPKVCCKPDLGLLYHHLEPTFHSGPVDVQIGELLVTKGGPLNEMERVHPRLDMRKDQARNDSMVSRSANLSSLGEFPLTVIDMAFTYIYIYVYNI